VKFDLENNNNVFFFFDNTKCSCSHVDVRFIVCANVHVIHVLNVK
jgi:hypothetical protein